MVVVAIPTPGAGFSPAFYDQVVRFIEAVAIKGGVDVVCQLLRTAPAYDPRDEAALRDHVDHR